MRVHVPRTSQDIVAKYLTAACTGEVLHVLGMETGKVVRALPTELPRVVVRQSLTDIVLETDTGEILHIEFQSSRESALYRFLAYDVALADKFRRPVRTYVLYTQAISHPPAALSIGCATYRVQNVFLANMDGEETLDIVEAHLKAHQWSSTDRVRLAFAFHMRYSTISTDNAFRRILNLTCQTDREEQNHIVALILGFSGRHLSSKQTDQILEVLEMTEIMRIVERKAMQKGREEGRGEGSQKRARAIAEALLRKGRPWEEVAEVTELSPDQVRDLARHLGGV